MRKRTASVYFAATALVLAGALCSSDVLSEEIRSLAQVEAAAAAAKDTVKCFPVNPMSWVCAIQPTKPVNITVVANAYSKSTTVHAWKIQIDPPAGTNCGAASGSMPANQDLYLNATCTAGPLKAGEMASFLINATPLGGTQPATLQSLKAVSLKTTP